MSESTRFSMELDDERRKILEEVEERIEGNTLTASVINALEQGLQYEDKKEQILEEINHRKKKWNIDE